MNKEIKKTILQKIKEYETVIISRHVRPDGDAVGSTKGLAEMIGATYPGKRVFLDNSDRAVYLAFLGDEGELPTDEDYENALVIVIDTATTDRIANKRYTKGKELIKIDHHVENERYGDVSWVEDDRAAACEMIAELACDLPGGLILNKDSALYLYAGIVTDSGRFRYRETSERTFNIAARLIGQGFDAEWLYANLYMNDYKLTLLRAEMAKKIKMTESGVAYLRIPRSFRVKHGILLEEASAMVSLMDSIKDSLIWIAFIETDDSSVRVRLRSRFVEIQKLATHFNGGGHACASGATVYSRAEEKALLKEADGIHRRYKAENQGWI